MKCFNTLKIVQLQIYLFIWCGAAETDLGQNVTLNCDLDENEVIWLFLKLDSPVLILRTFSATPPFYFKSEFKQKYSVLNKRGLFINNDTVDDLGVYYCMKISPPQKYSSGTRLSDSVHAFKTKNTAVNVLNITTADIHRHTAEQNHWRTITLISGVINALLIAVITALLRCFICGSKRTRDSVKLFQEMEVTDRPEDSTQVQMLRRLLTSASNSQSVSAGLSESV
ncbi:uncharacterized protein LOC122327829 isoform X1 [Puntigrus tetrazona]|uniref:uncharacterized protein LOC122327829 isoform X1 n=1 Tax=Puntigrus tetrazona TaxID=1606681 RepID=UPI001C89324A|nr:uncharacterized protein LOC122327829 isoform X1 [Puntigrus tetrazona]